MFKVAFYYPKTNRMKPVFPKEFADLLNADGLKILNHPGKEKVNDRIKVVANIIKATHADKIQQELNKNMYQHVKEYYTPIPENWQKEIKKNFHDKLGKTMKFKSMLINSRNNAYNLAADIGLLDMLNSASFKKMGEVILNKDFGSPIGKQVICYEDGGYVSPHTDYFPEYPNLKNGYFDIHLMFSNNKVKHQSLVYERNGFLNNVVDISCQSAMAVYHLPFWHYTTPLMPVTEKGGARRWLILASFEEKKG